MNAIGIARFLRWMLISRYLTSGDLTPEEAKELLNAPLDPDDPSTLVDDRDKLGLSVEEVQRIFASEGVGDFGAVVLDSGGKDEQANNPGDDL